MLVFELKLHCPLQACIDIVATLPRIYSLYHMQLCFQSPPLLATSSSPTVSEDTTVTVAGVGTEADVTGHRQARVLGLQHHGHLTERASPSSCSAPP